MSHHAALLSMLLFGVLLLSVATTVAVAVDAARHGQNAVLWSAVAFVTWPIGLIVWLAVRTVRTPRSN